MATDKRISPPGAPLRREQGAVSAPLPAPGEGKGAAGRWVAGLLLLAALVRWYWGTRARIVWGDEPFYLWLGQSLLDGTGYQFFGISGVHFSPLFPLLAGFIAKLAGMLGAAGPQALMAGSAALYLVCGALLVLPVYGIARRLAGDAAGLAAGLATAVYPALTAAVPLWGTMSEPLYLLLIAAAWWALLVALETHRTVAYAAAAVLLGLAYLTRTEALVYVITGAGGVLLLDWLIPAPEARSARPMVRLGRPVVGVAVLLVAFGIVISPYLILLHAETGQWQLAEEAGSTYVSAQGLARNDVAAFDRATWGLDPASGQVYLFSPASEGQGLLDAIAADPQAFIRLLLTNGRDLIATTFSGRLLPWPLIGVILLGLIARPWDTRRLRGELLLLAALAGPLSFLPFFIQDRYLAGVLIPALVWIGGGTAWLGDWLADTLATVTARPAWRKLFRSLPALLVVLALLWQGPRLWTALHRTSSFQPGHLAAAAELSRLRIPSDTVVLSRYPAIAFHAGTRWAPTPATTWDEVAAYAERKRARYLAIDGWEAKLRPQLAFLLDPGAAPRALRHVATLTGGSSPVVLYEFR